MTDRDLIIAWAREAHGPITGKWWDMDTAALQRFASLVAAHEREQCARVCEEVSLQAVTAWKLAYQPQDQGREIGADDCAAAIRGRAEK